MNNYEVDEQGYYGEFGGAFIPEMLVLPVEILRKSYKEIIESETFQTEFSILLKDYVGRPTPLYFAERTSKRFGGKIYFKREDLCHTGAHKINNAVGQALLAERLGKKRIICETGAGQHGVATATVCALRGLSCVVYMGEVDMQRQAPNVSRMRLLGAEVRCVTSGSRTLKDATNEAMRDWIANPLDTHYIIGSAIGPHPFPDIAVKFQSIIGREIKEQSVNQLGRKPSAVLACVGGGSNAIGAFHAFLTDDEVALIGVEAAGEGVETRRTAASLTKGSVGVLHGCKTKLLQTSDGQVLEAHSVSAGLDYPGVGPMHSYLQDIGRVQYVSVTDTEALNAVKLCARDEGIIPALESAHALAHLGRLSAMERESVVVCLSGRGDKDLTTYLTHNLV